MQPLEPLYWANIWGGRSLAAVVLLLHFCTAAAPFKGSTPPGPSHSQFCEDLYAYWHWFAGAEAPVSGYFVELGAMDGAHFSNSLFFEESLGWGGLLIEANPLMFAYDRGAGGFLRLAAIVLSPAVASQSSSVMHHPPCGQLPTVVESAPAAIVHC